MEDILVVSFFDPHWMLDMPKWSLTSRTTNREMFEIRKQTQRAVVDMVKACAPLETQLKKDIESFQRDARYTIRNGISPTTQATALATDTVANFPSSHHSNQMVSTANVPGSPTAEDFQHPGPQSPDRLAPSSADSNTAKQNMKRRKENTLDGAYMGADVHHGQRTFHVGWADEEQGIVSEI